MTSAYDENATDVGLSLDMIEEEIEAGLPLHADRLVEAYINEEYYAGRNAAFVPRYEGEDYQDRGRRPIRTSKITRKVIRELAKDLYATGPTRRLVNGEPENKWLQAVYSDNRINAVMQAADRKSCLNAVAAIQAECTGRPQKPVQLYLWGAHEFAAWAWPDDPTEVWAVCTIARERRVVSGSQRERLRYEAWSRDEHRVYLSTWSSTTAGSGHPGAYYRSLFGVASVQMPMLSGIPAGSGVNPYGCLPFSFVRDEPCVSSFWEGGIGSILRECNAEADREMSDVASHAKEFMDGDRFLKNVSTNFRREKSRSRWQPLPPVPGAKDGDTNLEPDAIIVQGELNVEAVWYNITTYVNNTLEDLDVPLVAVRDSASTDLSGVAIVAKQLPLLSRTRSRQQPFTVTEDDLASMVLTCAGNFYGESRLLAAGEDTDLETTWPEPSFPLPTPERDLEDDGDLAAGRKSMAQIVAERNGITREEAWEKLEQVLEDNKRYRTMLEAHGQLPPPVDPALQLPAPDPNDPANQLPAPDPSEQDPES